MNIKRVYNFGLLLILLFLTYSCKKRLTDEEICKFNWKWYDGAHFGDFIHCEIYKCQVKGDTLFTFNHPTYFILEAYEDKLAKNEKMEIIDLSTGDTATYIGK